MDEKVHQYIENLTAERSDYLMTIEQYAKENGVPIMELAGIETLLQFLRLQQPKKLLEIGTAIGYSALRIASEIHQVEIVSIERDQERYEKAQQFVQQSGVGDRITLLYGDAFDLIDEVATYGPFDAVFIDAAKSQSDRFFASYEPLFAESPVVYTDNVLFKGLVAHQTGDESRNVRQMLRKINRFNEWIMAREDYHTVIIPVGDGLAISKKR
ncbi:O-methyltransferase [Jeotgalibacillus sp. R-1-5s-1]|uniref:O-methyltransferase n=1 Tax=Jeotgalibacillus sp. R-1-5s-1 TaxID=2555897 RepID=UPI00106D1812|nr:O-methyltransferase [Jeotgalibacillus sp. R-1-5s-1]TFD92366.1 O-methyltransferase [Jeotgalibacillus sp. R-1-5s-1]